MTKKNADGLADFVRGLPEGQRHNGFFWAVHTAVEDGMSRREVGKIEQAAVNVGLDEDYVRRTVKDAREGEPA